MSVLSKMLRTVIYAVATDATHRQNVADFLSVHNDPQLAALADDPQIAAAVANDPSLRDAISPTSIIQIITALFSLVTNPQVAAIIAQIIALIKPQPTPVPAPVHSIPVAEANPPG